MNRSTGRFTLRSRFAGSKGSRGLQIAIVPRRTTDRTLHGLAVDFVFDLVAAALTRAFRDRAGILLCHRLLRTATLTLTSTGNLGGEVNELRWGAPAGDSRAQFLNSSPSDRPEVFEKFLGTFLNNFTLTNASVDNLDKYDENFTLHYQFFVEGYAKTAGYLLILRPRIVGDQGSNILTGKPRKYPIEFQGTTLQSDIFDITLPAGYVVDELPQSVDAKCDYASYKSDVQVKDNVLHYKRTYEIKGVVVPTEKLPEVRDFFRQVAADEKSSAVLRRSNP